MGHTHRYKSAFKKKNQVKSPSICSRVPELGSDPPIGSDRDSGLDKHNLETALQRCIDKNLALNWEKCHFMVIEGIVLGHKISVAGLEVDQPKFSIVETLFPPTKVRGTRSFLRHAGFYRRFIKDFSKILRSLCRLLEKGTKFECDGWCKCAFEEIKDRLIRAPIMETPD